MKQFMKATKITNFYSPDKTQHRPEKNNVCGFSYYKTIKIFEPSPTYHISRIIYEKHIVSHLSSLIFVLTDQPVM